jgi:hypothetical protein
VPGFANHWHSCVVGEPGLFSGDHLLLAPLRSNRCGLGCDRCTADLPHQGWMLERQEVGCYVWIMSLQILACNLIWREWLRWRERQARVDIGLADPTSRDSIAPAT